MLIKIKEVVKHTSFYALGNISIKLVGFILLPLYTKEISVADYGVWGLFEVTEMLMTPILLIGLPHALLRWHGLAKSGGGKKNLFTVFIFLLVVCVVFLGLAILGRALFSNFLFGNSSYENYFIPLFLAIVFSVLSRVPLTLLRSEEKSFLFSVSVVTRFTISLVLNVYFIAILKLGVLGILIAHAISSGIVFVLLLPYLFRKMQPSFEIQELKKMIVFGYPFVFSAIAAAVLASGDRYLIREFFTLHEVGLYTLGHKFSNVLTLFLVESFSLGFPVIGWKMIKEEKKPQRFFSKTLTYFIFVLLWFGLVLSVYAKGIIHRFALNPDYWDAYKVIPLLTLAIVFIGMERVFFFLLQIPKKTNYIFFIIAGAALLNIVLNLILLPLYGIMGAAVAKVLAHVCAVIYAYHLLQNVYPVKFEMKRIFVLFVTGIGLYFLTTLFNDFSLLERIIYKGMILLSYPFLLYFVNFYEPIELDRIRGSIRKWRNKIRLLLAR